MFRANNSFLRYSCCWEDPDLLLRFMPGNPDDRLLSVCSGGDNSLSLLTLDPQKVVVTDVNPIQIYLLELKMCAIRFLEREACLDFLGFTPSSTRNEVYELIRLNLTNPARSFWDTMNKSIVKGVIYSGYAEQNIIRFAHYYRPLMHSTRTTCELLSLKPESEQIRFYHEVWNTPRWRILFRLFFNNTVLRLTGPDADYFNYNDRSLSAWLRGAIERHLTSQTCQFNPFLHYGLLGAYGDCLPHYMQSDNYYVIRERLDRIVLQVGYVEDAITNHNCFEGFNLSNIFDYLRIDEFTKLAMELKNCSESGARVIYWNSFLPYRLAEVPGISAVNLCDISNEKRIVDFGVFYKRFLVDHFS